MYTEETAGTPGSIKIFVVLFVSLCVPGDLSLKVQTIDTITHIVSGACIGEAMMGKHLGRKSLWIGAFAQSFPDLDFITASWNDASGALLAHRGFSHSVLFGLSAAVVFTFLSKRLFKNPAIAPGNWFLFFGIEIIVHLFTDLFNAYGTGLLEPFSHQRFSFHTIYVADPFFSIWLILACIAFIILPSGRPARKTWLILGLGMSTLYLVFASVQKLRIEKDTKQILQQSGIKYNRLLTTPTPLNSFLWFVAAEDAKGFYVGYRSVFDQEDSISWHFFPRNDSLLAPVRQTSEVNNLLRFSQGYYTVQQWHDTIVFNDLRFGQVVGWYNPDGRFAFHYYLDHRDRDNRLVVQRGRFAQWNRETMTALIDRIKGD